MKKLILFMLCFPYFVLADSYSSFKNFRVEDSGQVIGGTDIAGGYQASSIFFTNSYPIVTLSSNEVFECKSFFSPEQSYGNLSWTTGSGDLNRTDQQLTYLTVIDQGEIWSKATVSDGATVIGPGTVYVNFKFRKYPYSSYSNPAGNVVTMDYNIRWNLRYQIVSEQSESKFSVSLDNDGDRVAMGYKEAGIDAVIRVYEFDGSSWNQLGEDIE